MTQPIDLEALDARLESAPIKRVLLVCTRNACRSPMAEGFLRAWGPPGIEVASAGTRPLIRIDPMAVHVMGELGIDIRSHLCRRVSLDLAMGADLVIHLRGTDEMPLAIDPARLVEWEVEDPLGWPLDTYTEVRDEIARRVRHLIERLSPVPVETVVEPSWPTEGDLAVPMTP